MHVCVPLEDFCRLIGREYQSNEGLWDTWDCAAHRYSISVLINVYISSSTLSIPLLLPLFSCSHLYYTFLPSVTKFGKKLKNTLLLQPRIKCTEHFCTPQICFSTFHTFSHEHFYNACHITFRLHVSWLSHQEVRGGDGCKRPFALRAEGKCVCSFFISMQKVYVFVPNCKQQYTHK